MPTFAENYTPTDRRLTEMRDEAMGCLDCLSWKVYSFDVGVRAHSNEK
ncbi:hypothetical protein SAMN06295955_10776 [Sphingopyxis indica]|uniref:Uncharacterized protein n=1 Tax=Sphingopyxis indica TaxID=436663 RepID=A0A239I6W6_9SPHN|nr:hypothetical protein SAMN06295955_10776 [Sphingopyxis indica]